MTIPPILGLDVGGANLKAVWLGSPGVVSRSRPFVLWRDPARLPSALASLLAELPHADEFAVTMTGELCDCFTSKREGVLHILAAVQSIATNRPVHVWTTEGHFVDLETARMASPLTIAASNWLALATWAGRLLPLGTGLLLDIGSTTTDIIALHDGKPTPQAAEDFGRLQSGELVYRGARRTPLCALTLPDEPVAAEFFATTLDLVLILGYLRDDPTDTDTADGRPATRDHALARLNRLFCLDAETVEEPFLIPFAQTLFDRLVAHIAGAVERRLEQASEAPHGVVLAGSGEFLGQEVLARVAALKGVPVHALAQMLGQALSTAACANAVAVLASEERP